MTCNIIFVRHGQSEGNLYRDFLGHTDRDLTDLGRCQAEKTAEFLKDRRIDVIYSSDLKRAFHTALPLARIKGLPIIKNENLREIYAGLWENVNISTIKEKYSESYGIWQNNIGRAVLDGGESVLQLQERIVKEIEKIIMENDGKTVAVFTHATPVRTFFSYINGKSIDEIIDIPWPLNASVSEAVFKDGKFSQICYGVCDFMADLTSPMPKGI
ncbi:MAG: histidine phosphatase family protein [Ruminococcaceae bacterium]|nr:histidine phosphatase family protein [Oscillospiraceae bacterium]